MISRNIKPLKLIKSIISKEFKYDILPEQYLGPAVTPPCPPSWRVAALLERWQLPSCQNEKKLQRGTPAQRSWQAAALASDERPSPGISSIGSYLELSWTQFDISPGQRFNIKYTQGLSH